MNLVHRASPLALSVALVSASLLIAFALPTPVHAAVIPQAHPVRDFVSNPEKNKERLTRTAPALNADKIRTPPRVVQPRT